MQQRKLSSFYWSIVYKYCSIVFLAVNNVVKNLDQQQFQQNFYTM